MRLNPIPPGLWCVPAALVAITGDDFESVIHPALNRYNPRATTLTGLVASATVNAALATLQERNYRVSQYKGAAPHVNVARWAQRSAGKYAGRRFLVFVAEHALALCDGIVYDTWTPHGEPGATHPYATAIVKQTYAVEKK